MARGWESKSVADQIEEGNSTRAHPLRGKPRTPEEQVRQERLTSLALSKSRLLQQLERAKHPSHRGVLLNGLKAIEEEIDDLSVDP
jgi:hypothetical protein